MRLACCPCRRRPGAVTGRAALTNANWRTKRRRLVTRMFLVPRRSWREPARMAKTSGTASITSHGAFSSSKCRTSENVSACRMSPSVSFASANHHFGANQPKLAVPPSPVELSSGASSFEPRGGLSLQSMLGRQGRRNTGTSLPFFGVAPTQSPAGGSNSRSTDGTLRSHAPMPARGSMTDR